MKNAFINWLRILKAIEWLCGRAHLLGEIAALLLLIEVFYTVIMRYIFNLPPTWSEEIGCYIFIFVVLIPIAEVLKNDKHIYFELLMNRVSIRNKNLLQLISSIAGFVFCGLLFLFGADYVIYLYKFDFKSSTLLAVPYWVPYSIIPLAFFLICLVFIVKINICIRKFLKHSYLDNNVKR
jgi:C4-dicarboxylate transporter DctQ subunit